MYFFKKKKTTTKKQKRQSICVHALNKCLHMVKFIWITYFVSFYSILLFLFTLIVLKILFYCHWYCNGPCGTWKTGRFIFKNTYTTTPLIFIIVCVLNTLNGLKGSLTHKLFLHYQFITVAKPLISCQKVNLSLPEFQFGPP